MQHRGRMLAAITAALMLAALACTCGPLGQLANVPATLGAAGGTLGALGGTVEEYYPTLEAQLTQFGPTVAAEATQIAEAATRLGPTAIAMETAAAATAAAIMTQIGTLQPPVYDGGDGLQTMLTEYIALGETRTASLEDLFSAHNWLFEGVAGEQVTIRVNAVGDSDPRLRLIDPNGNVIAENDDAAEGDLSAEITITLPMNGVYTARVDMFVAGEYSIVVR